MTVLRDQADDRIRSVVLDSVVPLQADLVRTGSAVERSFDKLLADCAADPDCDSAFPNLRQTSFDLIDRLNREPLMPIDPATQQPFPAIISGDRLVRLAESGFQSASLIPTTFITTTAAGSPGLLNAALSVVASPELYSPGVQTAVLCNEETAHRHGARAAGAGAGQSAARARLRGAGREHARLSALRAAGSRPDRRLPAPSGQEDNPRRARGSRGTARPILRDYVNRQLIRANRDDARRAQERGHGRQGPRLTGCGRPAVGDRAALRAVRRPRVDRQPARTNLY